MSARLVALSVALALTATASAEEKPWKEFTSKEAGFTVLFPGKPKQSKQEAAGTTVLQYSVELDGVAYMAAFAELPAKVTEIKPVLDGARDGAVRNTKGKLVKESEITLGKDKHPGREILVEVADNNFLRQRFYIVNGNQMPQVVVVGKKEAVTGKDADRFLDSFKLDK
jgi:hypothetical protein